MSRADDLFYAAEDQFCAAMQTAAKIPDEAARRIAFEAAHKAWELKREYQRKIRHEVAS